jgi:hypothetical protein
VPIALPLPVTFVAENEGTGPPPWFLAEGASSPADFAADDDERESTGVAEAPDRSDVELRQENTRPAAMSQARVQSDFIGFRRA